MIERKYFDFYDGVHVTLCSIYRWFIRYNIEGVAEKPYYCNGEKDEVIKDALNGFINAGVEVIDNEWSTCSLNTPSQYNVIKQRDKITITEVFKDVRGDLAGYKRNDSWLFHRYSNPKTLSYVHWTPQDEYMTFSYRKEAYQLRWNGVEFKSHIGSLGSNGTTTRLGASLPYEYRISIVVPLINELRSKGNNGQYEEIAKELMRLCEVKFTEVKDARVSTHPPQRKRIQEKAS